MKVMVSLRFQEKISFMKTTSLLFLCLPVIIFQSCAYSGDVGFDSVGIHALNDRLSESTRSSLVKHLKIPSINHCYAWRLSDVYLGDHWQVYNFVFNAAHPGIYARLPKVGGDANDSTVLSSDEPNYISKLSESLSDIPSFRESVNKAGKQLDEKQQELLWFHCKLIAHTQFGGDVLLLEAADKDEDYETVLKICGGVKQKLPSYLALCVNPKIEGTKDSWKIVFYTILADGKAMKGECSGAHYNLSSVTFSEIHSKNYFW
jgi:hypothetical protein